MSTPEVPDETTMGEARQWFLTRVDDGVKCPLCTQHAQVYRRKINSGMARSLIRLHRAGGANDFLHIPTVLDARSREEGKLAYWGLIEEEKIRRPDGGRAGYWRITQQGVDFVMHRTLVPKYVYVFDSEVMGSSSDLVSITDALGAKFDYNALMAGEA